MTRSAAILWARRAGHVLGMIELQVEAFFEFVGEGFQRRISAADIGVADRAHRGICRDELCPMAFNAIFVSGKAGPGGIIIPMMTTGAGSRCVTLTAVQELRVVEIVALRQSKGKRKKEKVKSEKEKTERKTFCAYERQHLYFCLFTFALLCLALLCHGLVARRRLLLPDIRGVTIGAAARFLKVGKLFFDSYDLRVSCFLVVLVTASARGDWNIGSQSTQRAGAGNVDMTGRALHDVFTFAAFVTEHRRLAYRQIDRHERSGRLMATDAVVSGRFLIFPMAVEARVVTVRHRLEKPIHLRRRPWRGRELRDVDLSIRLVTDRAVVVVRLLLVISLRGLWLEE